MTYEDDEDRPPIRVERVVRRVTYTGGKREERKLAGKVAAIGTRLEHTDASTVQDDSNYARARAAFYHRNPAHPNHPRWRPELDAALYGRLGAAGRAAYFEALFVAIAAWRAANPQVHATHPASADWRRGWDALRDDPDQLWPARNAFLMAHKIELSAVPGLWEALREQLRDFMRAHYEAR